MIIKHMRGEHMGTGIDHLTEQRAGGVSEVSSYSTLYC